MKAFFIPKMNIVVILFTFLCFVMLDTYVVPAIVTHNISADSNYRTPVHFGYAELKVLIDQVNANDSPKVILVGDSIVYGGGVSRGNETISAYLGQELKAKHSGYQVYNLGLSGAAPADVFFILKTLELTITDIVIYNLNIGHFGSSRIITYPHITAKLTARSYKGQPLNDKLNIESENIEDRLTRLIRSTWKLYAYKDVLYEMWQEVIQNKAVAQEEENDFDTTPWHVKDWTEKTKGKAKRGSSKLNESDPHLYFLKLFMEVTRDSDTKLFTFNSPLNQEMMNEYDMIDRSGYDENMRVLAKIVLQSGADYFDYEKLIPSSFFTDSLHPMKEGNLTIAKKLVQDLSDRVLRKEPPNDI